MVKISFDLDDETYLRLLIFIYMWEYPPDKAQVCRRALRVYLDGKSVEVPDGMELEDLEDVDDIGEYIKEQYHNEQDETDDSSSPQGQFY